jgi:Sap, sulfolipid-1-addressing protein
MQADAEETSIGGLDHPILHALPAAVAIAVNPVPVIAALVMPTTRRPYACSVAYVVALVGVMAAFGLIVLSLLQGLASSGSGTSHEVFEWIWLAIGVGFLAAFAVILVKRPAAGHEADEPSWMRRIEGMGPAGAALVGVMLVNYELEMPALSDILDSGASRPHAFAALLVLVLVACSTPALTVLAYIAAPRLTGGALQTGKAWLTRYNRPILLVIFIAVGVFYTYKGVRGVLA